MNLNRLMGEFKQFFEDYRQVDRLLSEFNAPVTQALKPKPWTATKKQVLQMWKTLRPNMPILIAPMNTSDNDHDSYGEDGVRITGSWSFIASVLSRLKDIMNYENPKTRLRLVFRGIDSPRDARPDRPSFVFYINLEDRGQR